MPAARRSGRRRLLLLIFHLGPAGMERQLLHLAQGLAERGDEVTIGCFNRRIDTRDVEAAGVRIVVLGDAGRAGRLLAGRRIAGLARRRDLVHCTGWDASLWGRLGGLPAGRPLLVTDHSPGREFDRTERGASRERLIAWHNRLLDPVTYATVAVARRQLPVLRAEGVRADKLVHIPNGVPLAAVRAAATGLTRADLGLPPGARVVVHLARFGPQKRQHVTYEAIRDLRAGLGEDVHVLFAGHGEEGRARLARRARDEGAGWAHVLGVRDDVPALLGLADVAVLPSAAEALPMVVIEALAVGVPQVATDVGEVGAALRPAGAGLVVGVDDRDGFRDAVGRVLTDPALAARLREGAREGARAFDGEVMVERYSALFDAALAGRAPASALG